MAIEQGYSKIVTQGLKFSYDTGDTRNSYTGRPTTNISAGIGMSTYNNVPGNVTSTLTGTGTYYRGAEIIRQDLTALDGSGASYLSNGNNPGIGVVTGGGGGIGGRYTGHSIFFKPTVTTTSCPVYTHYSNIGGWQSTCDYDDMGDGWFRARVIWYAGSTASDGKYWAINPLSTSTGQTVTVYWAGPFKEDLNVTNVSQYINGTRSATQGLLDLTGNYSMSLSNVSFDNSAFPQITFDGSNDYFDINSDNIIGGTQDFTIDAAYNHTGTAGGEIFGNYGTSYTSNTIWFSGQYGFYLNGSCYAPSLPVTGKNHMVATRESGVVRLYLNGNLVNTVTLNSSVVTTINYRIGADVNGAAEPFTGQIYSVKVYNRALSAGEVRSNYNHYKTRFNLP
jgi:hypothetical protein